MRAAKRTWRRFTGRPVRKFRRFFKARKGKGKGRGKGKKGPSTSFMWSQEDVASFLSGKGKGNRSHSSGKGFGRRKNPKDRNGEIMKCHECNSEDHLVSQCPLKGKGKGGGSPSMVNFWSTGASADQGSGSQSVDAPQSAFTARRLQAAEIPTETSPPWLSEDLLYEPPMTTSLGYVQTL